MSFRLIIIMALSTTYFSCRNSTEEKDNTTPGTNVSNKAAKISDIEPNIRKANSMQVLYYDDPDGDPLRYTRFFSYIETSDSNQVHSLVKEWDESFVKQDKKIDCRSEGKLFLMNKEEILKTIYFSTRGDSCSYMYFIKDGLFIHFPLTKKAKEFLTENKRLAKKL